MIRSPVQHQQFWRDSPVHCCRIRGKGLHLVSAMVVALALTACGSGSASTGRTQGRRELGRSSDAATITMTEVARLSFAGLPRAPDAFATVFRLPDGGWGVSAEPFIGVIQRFDSAGAPAGTLGHRGQGPGELRGLVLGVSVGDDLWVVDPGNGRLNLFSKDLAFRRSRPLPYRVFSASSARRGTGLLLSGFFHPAGADSIGWSSVARVSMDGRADAFGGSIPDIPEKPLVEMQFAAATPAGEVWTVARKGGAIDVLRGGDLAPIEQFRLPGVPRAEDIPPRLCTLGTHRRPSPEVGGIGIDPHGVLWVLILAADADWTPQMRPSIDGINSMGDVRVLAIDPATRTVVGERLLDDVCLPAGGSLISCVYEGDQVIGVRKLTLASE